MDEHDKAFARRYRSWFALQTPDRAGRKTVWSRISRALELGQGPPHETRPHPFGSRPPGRKR